MAKPLYDRIPDGLSAAQQARTVRELDRIMCMMVHWFEDRARTCPDSLEGTIETYKGLVLAHCHEAVPGDNWAMPESPAYLSR